MNICINIIVPALKRLTLRISQEYYDDIDFKILIDTPMLEYIHLGDAYMAAYSVTSLPSLVEAILDVGMDYHDEDYIGDDNRSIRAIELIRGLSNAKYLSVINGASAALDRADQVLPILHGVTSLELDDLPLAGLSLIPRFLESAPNLKEVVVKIQPDEAVMLNIYRQTVTGDSHLPLQQIRKGMTVLRTWTGEESFPIV
ncbi:hypothetical protein POM88_030389 [Heracleum sosnowskyi]|uniref:Uncharacterized protein n=1 Tax=Heracleum sosnowskyi TaxID=360622 RepID=A0AAD8HVU9_9APIA|nr:hypothetical protein POM88_030389 [Heracleum sosnowskyi]